MHSALDARMSEISGNPWPAQLEAMTPHRRAANSMIATSKPLQEHRVKVRQRYRNVVETWFAAELDALTDASRKKWLIAVATLVDWEMWQSLRTYPARSINEVPRPAGAAARRRADADGRRGEGALEAVRGTAAPAMSVGPGAESAARETSWEVRNCRKNWRVWDWEPAINNALIPVMSEPHPTEPDRLVMKEIPGKDIAAVKEAFKIVVDDLKDWRPS